MPDASPFHDSQKLMRCTVANRYNETSVRFVALDAFKLWEYLMTHKHGQHVGEPTLCLWVDSDEYERNASLFDRAGLAEPVDRIVVDLFDAEYGCTQTTNRFARHSESERVVDILRSHIPEQLRDSNACQIDIVQGYTVQHIPHHASRTMMTGLEG